MRPINPCCGAPAAAPSAHYPGAGGAISRPLRHPARAVGPSLHGSRPHGAGHAVLAASRATSAPALRQSRGGQPRDQGLEVLRAPAGDPRAGTAGTGPPDHAGGGVGGPPRAKRPRRAERTYARACALARQVGSHRSCSRRCGGSGMPIWRGDSCHGRGSWRRSSWNSPSSSTTHCSW